MTTRTRRASIHREIRLPPLLGKLSIPLLLAVLLLVAGLPLARAGVADAAPEQLEVSLVTYGPGDTYWERFGHDAIEIRDRGSGQAVNFNYGVFDFDQDNFLLNFARGRMRYSMDAELGAPEIDYYIRHGRSVTRQHLAFSPGQAALLRDALLRNLRPENRHYAYDYFTRNCATRVRDMLDTALGGLLASRLDAPAAGLTYRHETDRLMARQPWLMLLLDLGLSGYADQPLTRWQAAFIPMRLQQEIRHVRLPDGRPLVAREQIVAPSRLPAPPAHPPRLTPPLLATGLLLGILMAAGGRWRHANRAARVVFTATGTLWLLFAGLAGLFMVILWAFTQHQSAWANENLFLFNPLALLLMPSAWRRLPSHAGRVLAALLAVSALLGLGVKLLPAFHQHNLAWIALALPAWAGLLFALWRYPPASRQARGLHT